MHCFGWMCTWVHYSCGTSFIRLEAGCQFAQVQQCRRRDWWPHIAGFLQGLWASSNYASLIAEEGMQRHKTQSGFWYGFGSVLCLVPTRRKANPVVYNGRNLKTATASQSLKADWDAVFGDLEVSFNKVTFDESSLRETTRSVASAESSDDRSTATLQPK